MPDSAPSVSPAPAPILPPVTGAPAVTSPTPGWKTSEFWITLLVIIVGALPTSGLVAEGSQLAKVVGLAISVFTALGYMTARTSLKRAHVLGQLPYQLAQLAANDNGGACPACGATGVPEHRAA